MMNAALMRRFTVEVLVGSSWRPTQYQELTEKFARRWVDYYRRHGRAARLVRVQVEAERVVH